MSRRSWLTTSAIVLALAITATAGAATTTWTKTGMVAAVRALGYPKPHAKKVTCSKAGTAFRCTATYRTATRRFYTKPMSQGGWLCAGAKLATCKLLPRGFAAGPTNGDPHGVAELAAVGYMANKYHDPVPTVTAPCVSTAALTYTCQYAGNSGNITVTIRLKIARGGYIVSGSG